MSEDFQMQHIPTEIRLKKEEKVLEVEFNDGSAFSLPAELLRVESPSAEVQGHSPAEKKTVAGKRNVAITDVTAVGNYAVCIKFDDSHDSGIYTWDTLYEFGTRGDDMWANYLKDMEDKGLSRDHEF